MNRDDKIGLICVVLAGVAYCAFRVWNVTASCLWFDEIFSIHAAGMSFPDLFGFIAQDLIHPPLFYLLLKIWILLGGEGLFWVRLFPVFFSIAALVPFFLLCRELKLSKTTIAFALFFIACNGGLIRYSQEVRMYAPMLCLALLSMWLFARFLFLGKNIWFLTIVNVLLVHTHYFGWLVLVSEIAAIIVLQRIKIRQILIMFAISIAAFMPWTFAVWRASHDSSGLAQNIGWNAVPDLTALGRFFLILVEPFYYQQSNVDQASVWILTIPIAVLIGAFVTIRLIGWKSVSDDDRKTLKLLAIFVVLPTTIAFAASWLLPYSVWGARHLIIVFVPAALLIASVFTSLRPAAVSVTIAVLLSVLFILAFAVQLQRPARVFIWCAWENFALKLDESKATKVYVFEDVIAYDVWFALRERRNSFEIVKIEGDAGMPEDNAFFLPRGFDAVRKDTTISGERFYVMYRADYFDPNKPPLKQLAADGYKIGNPEIFMAETVNGFLIEVWK